MSTVYETKKIKIRALHDWIIVSDMNFGERVTAGGIVLRSDNAKAHGVYPRWGRVYAVGPEQTEISVGQWILVEHGRWTRGVKIDDGEGEKTIQKIDLNAILAVSDEEPSAEDQIYGDSV
jgi:co-chaperonin GroES (HSP10)